MIVPKEIDETEDCIRCVIRPLMYSGSKNRLKEPSVLPKPGDNKVSLLRLKYTADGTDFCVRHGLSLASGDSSFVGLAKLCPKIVSECNAEFKNNYPQSSLSAKIVCAPMSGGNYLPDDVIVDTGDDSIDLPMHADLTYSNIDNQEGEVKTSLRMYARELLKRVEFASYIDGKIEQWV